MTTRTKEQEQIDKTWLESSGIPIFFSIYEAHITTIKAFDLINRDRIGLREGPESLGILSCTATVKPGKQFCLPAIACCLHRGL
jgi:hypothetical protein